MKDKLIIGRTDKIDFPVLGISNIPAKIDTGAYTSSIHCTGLQLSNNTLFFHVPGFRHGNEESFTTKNFTQKSIKSSNGKSELRFVIKTEVMLFNQVFLEEFSLSNRSRMKNPVLLGRKVLKNRFIVDVSKKDLSFKAKQK